VPNSVGNCLPLLHLFKEDIIIVVTENVGFTSAVGAHNSLFSVSLVGTENSAFAITLFMEALQ